MASSSSVHKITMDQDTKRTMVRLTKALERVNGALVEHNRIKVAELTVKMEEFAETLERTNAEAREQGTLDLGEEDEDGTDVRTDAGAG